jgi:hypothetical protein
LRIVWHFAALASYQATLAIREQLAKSDPGNAVWQRDLIVLCVKIARVDPAQMRAMLMRALEIAKNMQAKGTLSPPDANMADELAKIIAGLPQSRHYHALWRASRPCAIYPTRKSYEKARLHHGAPARRRNVQPLAARRTRTVQKAAGNRVSSFRQPSLRPGCEHIFGGHPTARLRRGKKPDCRIPLGRRSL